MHNNALAAVTKNETQPLIARRGTRGRSSEMVCGNCKKEYGAFQLTAQIIVFRSNPTLVNPGLFKQGLFSCQ